MSPRIISNFASSTKEVFYSHATVFRPAKPKAIASLPSFDVGQSTARDGS